MAAPNQAAFLVLAAERDFFAALIAGRVDTLEDLLTADFTLADLAGSLVEKPGLLAAIASKELQFEAIDQQEARIRFYGMAALVTGSTQMSGRFAGSPFTAASRYTHVYVEQDGRWRLAAAQGTPII